ncbi:MAG: signal peptidase I [Solirubrobacteraceae bacterium]
MSSRTVKSSSGSLVELVVIVGTALGLALLIQAFLVKPYRIPSESMEPTLDVGQRVLVNRIGNRFSDPAVGEIMVFHPPEGWKLATKCANARQGEGHAAPCGRPTAQRSDDNFIKRVVGLPGDRIAIRGGHVIRNGRRESDTYIRRCQAGTECNFPQTITIPPGYYFMMGDNRGSSDDSRFWGPVPKRWIIGGAFATYWPPDRLGLL